MIQFIRDLVKGEPALFVGLVSTGLTAYQGALIAVGMDVPIVLAVSTPVWVAVGAFYIRSKVTPDDAL